MFLFQGEPGQPGFPGEKGDKGERIRVEDIPVVLREYAASQNRHNDRMYGHSES